MQADLARCDGEDVSNRLGAVVCDAAAEQVQDPLHVSLHLPRATLKRANACCTMRNVLGPLRRCNNVCDPRRRCNRWGRPDVCRTAGAGARHVSGSTRQLHAPKVYSAQERTTLAMSSADGSWYGVTVRLYLPARRAPPSAGADVAGASPAGCRCGRGEPSPGADVGGGSPVPVRMWQGRARSRCR